MIPAEYRKALRNLSDDGIKLSCNMAKMLLNEIDTLEENNGVSAVIHETMRQQLNGLHQHIAELQEHITSMAPKSEESFIPKTYKDDDDPSGWHWVNGNDSFGG